MKKLTWFSKWSILPLVLVAMLSALAIGSTLSYFSDPETSNTNTATAWASAQWTQTSQTDFNNGVSSNVDISTSPGDVLLPPVTTTSFSPSGNTGNWTNPTYASASDNQYATFTPPSATVSTRSPTANTGSAWTNPTNAYADATSAATITSGAPSGNNVWGTYGFSFTGNVTQVRVRYDAWVAPGLPVFRAAGAKASGTGAVTPALPGSMAANDIVILVATTVSGGTVTITANGSISTWTALTGSPIDPTTAEKMYIWWGRYSSGSTGPTVTPGGDHITAGIAAWYGCLDSGPPIDVSATGTEAVSDTSYSFATGLTTSANNEMVIGIVSSGADSNTGQLATHVNANLSSVTTRMNYNTNSGGGGGFSLAEGGRATAGAVGTWSGTMGTATYKGYISFALKPNYSQIRVDVSWDGGTSWSSKQTTSLTTSETTYWYDVTGATSWTSANLTDGQLQVRADAYTVGGVAGTVNLDWLPVEVTYSDMSTWSHTYTTYGIDLTGYLISTVEVGIEAYAASSEKVELEVTWNNGSSWSSKQTSSALGGADPNSTTWFDFTSATSWTPATLNNTNFKVKITYKSNGAYGQVSLDYIPVRVAGRVSSGTIASEVLDTAVTGSRWDGLFWDSTLPSSTNITFEVRASDTPFLKTDNISPSWTSVGSGSPTTSTLTNSPTANTGSAWTSPGNAYADATSAATITSGAPSGNNVWGTYGFDLTGKDITQVRVRYDAWVAPGLPVFRAAGAKAAGTGAVTPALPAGMAANDISVLVATTIAGGSISITADGSISPWTPLPGSPIDVTGDEKLYAWWGRYSSGSTGPTVTPGGDHITAGIAAWYGALDSASPIDVSATGTEATSDTSFSFATGLTTSANNEMVLVICTSGVDSNTGQFSGAFTNANLSSINTRMNYGTNSGDGGGFGLAEGGLATAGAVGTWTETLAGASPKAYISFALKPNYSQIRVDVSWNGGTSWSSKQTTNLTTSETTYWYDVTGATSWTSANLTDGQLQVRADAYTVGGVAGTVNLDWLPVEVTYYTSGTMGSISITNGTGRYKQWRATLTTNVIANTPTLKEVRLYYDGG